MTPTEWLDIELFRLSGTPVTMGTLFTASAIVLIALVVSRILRRTLAAAMGRRPGFEQGAVAAVQRLLHYAVMLTGVAVALDTLGISLGALFTAGAVFAVGLGFAMQNIAQNFVSGVILLAERSIKPGDVLEIQSTVVRVEELRIRSALVRTRDDEDLIVPNGLLVQSTVKNYTLRDSLYRLRASVGVSYASDLRVVERVLTEVAAAQTWRNRERDPRVLLTGFGTSSVDFDVSVWMDDPWEAPRSRAELNRAMWWALKEAGVVIAFPQVDVHFDRPVVDALIEAGVRRSP